MTAINISKAFGRAWQKTKGKMLANYDEKVFHDRFDFTLSFIHINFNTLKKKSFRKTLWKKLKFLKMSVVKSLPFPKQALVFTCLQYKSFENTVGKGEIACNKQFLHFPQCFLTVWRTICHFHIIPNCRLQSLSIWTSKIGH